MTIEYTYTGRDFTSEYNRLIALLQSELPEYTDLNHSDAGIVLLRLLARETDQLNNYIDRVFSEGFLQTALFKQSLIELGRLVDYLPELPSAATTTLLLTRQFGIEEDIPIAQYSEFTRSNGLIYTNLDAATLTGDTISIDVVQGEMVTVTKRSTDFTQTDWTGRLKLNLGAGIAAGYVTMQHGTTPVYTWTEVDSFWRSTATDRHFMLELDEDDNIWMVVGDGTSGATLPTLTDITISYLVTDGKAGNCGAGLITGKPESVTGLVMSVSNTVVANGGSDAESIESIRRNIPRVTRTQRRGVTLEDYEALIEHMSGVLWCQALDRNTLDYYPWEFVSLYVVPDGGGPMSDNFKNSILSELQDWGHMQNWSQRYLLVDAEEYPVDVTVRIGVSPGYNSNTVSAAVITSLNELFAIDMRGIAEPLSFTDLHYAVQNTTGVSYCEFTTPINDITPGDGAIITPGTFTVTVA